MPPKKRKPKNMKREADTLFSKLVRARGYCELSGVDQVKCNGNLQCAHVLSRRYHSVRWSEDNAFSLCQGHHTYYTHRPEAWFLLIEKLLPGAWTELWARAQVPWDRDIGAVLARLKEASKETA